MTRQSPQSKSTSLPHTSRRANLRLSGKADVQAKADLVRPPSASQTTESSGSDLFQKRFEVPPQSILKDPLTDLTRKERRSLLGLSAIGIVVSRVGLVPERISALGIEFQLHNQVMLLRLFGAVVAFYSIAFMIYALSDFVTWRIGLFDQIKAIIIDYKQDHSGVSTKISSFYQSPTLDQFEQDISSMQKRWNSISPGISFARGIFEFLIPLAISWIAIYLLFTFH